MQRHADPRLRHAGRRRRRGPVARAQDRQPAHLRERARQDEPLDPGERRRCAGREPVHPRCRHEPRQTDRAFRAPLLRTKACGSTSSSQPPSPNTGCPSQPGASGRSCRCTSSTTARSRSGSTRRADSLSLTAAGLWPAPPRRASTRAGARCAPHKRRAAVAACRESVKDGLALILGARCPAAGL